MSLARILMPLAHVSMSLPQLNVIVKYLALPEAVVAEWLRRLTRNQIPSGSVGSNPTDCESLFFFSVGFC